MKGKGDECDQSTKLKFIHKKINKKCKNKKPKNISNCIQKEWQLGEQTLKIDLTGWNHIFTNWHFNGPTPGIYLKGLSWVWQIKSMKK